MDNATFIAFKASGKYYSIARGHLPETAFNVFTREERFEEILKANGRAWPGLSGHGTEFHLVVNGDDELRYGFPLMFPVKS